MNDNDPVAKNDAEDFNLEYVPLDALLTEVMNRCDIVLLAGQIAETAQQSRFFLRIKPETPPMIPHSFVHLICSLMDDNMTAAYRTLMSAPDTGTNEETDDESH